MSRAAPRFAGARHTARSLALQVLLDCRTGELFVQEALDSALTTHHSPLTSPDRRLATQLVYGILRRRGTLDALLRAVVSRQPHDVEPWLWEALRLGAFQIALLTQIPPHAAVHETVELAEQFGRPAAKGFLNGVLRHVLPLATEERVAGPAADGLPLEGGQYRRLSRPVFPDPVTEPVPYLSAGFSLPRWLVRRWLDRYGWEECLRLGFWFAGQPPIWLRCNPLRIDRPAFLDALKQAGIAAEPGMPFLPPPLRGRVGVGGAQAVRLLESAPIRELPGYAEGWFTVQDESAMQAAEALAPAPGSRVLDLCAAPGGKTTHLAELMNNQGQIIACDVDPGRLETVRELCRRLGVTIVQTQLLASRGREHSEDPPAGPFEYILVDVPCSNTGVLGRRPEARWRLGPADFAHLVPLQTKLLIQAAERIRPGGTIVYSTCSIELEENRQVVDNVLLAMPDLELEADRNQAPGQPADGGYWARLRRKTL
jgi:16S rRNA (cytosine967-C5)-methyltransferase